MQKMFRPTRLGIFFVLVAASIIWFVFSLYSIQIFAAPPVDEQAVPMRTVTRTETLFAARGSIFDRNGVLLASGRPSYNIMLSRDVLIEIPLAQRNQSILDMIYFAMEHGIQYTDTLPITRGAPFSFLTDATSDQITHLNAFKEANNIDPDIDVQDFLAFLRRRYGIDYTIGISDARLIMGVRYELEMRVVIGTLSPYIFAEDVNAELIPLLVEHGFIGAHIERGFVREYHTPYAAHLLGYVRLASPADLERLADADPPYPTNAVIGVEGAERAFEHQLRGINGERTVTMALDGTIIDIEVTQEPIPGNNIFLTMDIGLQAATESALRMHIESRNLDAEHAEELIPGGAAVVVNMEGELLASASFPTFDRFTYTRDFNMLAADPTWPLLNRALMGHYTPGSTFKMVTGFAALRAGTVGRWTPIFDSGVYHVIDDHDATLRPRCWIYPIIGAGHGNMDIVQALAQSCNYFFFHVSDRMHGGDAASAWAIAEAAQQLGLGIRTGIEVPASAGVLATPDSKLEILGEPWRRGDTVLTSFGQGLNRFSPLQLANHSATIGNGGVLHEVTLLRRVRSADMSDLVFSRTPVVLNRLNEEDQEHLSIIQEGMTNASMAAHFGTGASVFSDHPIRVASKTGTIQIEGQEVNDAAFICYAPVGNPEIAISVVVERGGSGAAIMDIARVIIDHYFREPVSVLSAPFGELIQ
jgi:penicillin-binding protein 2